VLAPTELELDAASRRRACDRVPAPLRAALELAAARVAAFHRTQLAALAKPTGLATAGAVLESRPTPLRRVAVYAPGGTAAYPSSVLMAAIPAKIAGVDEVLLFTPRPSDVVVLAAEIAGVDRIFVIGGAQAIAAAAFGTASIPRVDKIVGPGNAYVQHAKRLVFGEVGIDSEAGPTEVLVVADKSATPAWVAADLLSQAEHEEDASAVLITHVRPLVARVKEQLARQLEDLPRAKIAREALRKHGVLVLSKDLEQSFELANRYAPEHMVIASDAAETLLKKVVNAGTVFLGHYTPVAVGDYLAGPNHVLPTGGTARFFSPLGVDDFLKRTAFVRFEPPKLRELGSDVIRLAALEGFDGHGQSVELRLAKIRRARREREAAREAESDGAEWDL
jgi:histidinol dehydrogenase